LQQKSFVSAIACNDTWTWRSQAIGIYFSLSIRRIFSSL